MNRQRGGEGIFWILARQIAGTGALDGREGMWVQPYAGTCTMQSSENQQGRWGGVNTTEKHQQRRFYYYYYSANAETEI